MKISANAPFMAPNQTPFLLSIWASWRDSIKRRRRLGAVNDAGSNVERAEMTMHVGTHIDADLPGRATRQTEVVAPEPILFP